MAGRPTPWSEASVTFIETLYKLLWLCARDHESASVDSLRQQSPMRRTPGLQVPGRLVRGGEPGKIPMTVELRLHRGRVRCGARCTTWRHARAIAPPIPVGRPVAVGTTCRLRPRAPGTHRTRSIFAGVGVVTTPDGAGPCVLELGWALLEVAPGDPAVDAGAALGPCEHPATTRVPAIRSELGTT